MNKRNVLLAATDLAIIIFLIGCGASTSAPGAPTGTAPSTASEVKGVVTQDGLPTAGITVSLLGVDEAGDEMTSKTQTESESQQSQADTPSPEVQTDINGQFVFKEVTPGEYAVGIVVTITNEGLRCVATAPVKVEANKQVNVAFEVPKEVSITAGMGILPDGKPLLCVKAE